MWESVILPKQEIDILNKHNYEYKIHLLKTTWPMPAKPQSV